MADYRLPLDPDPGWQLWNGNWDDPVAGHGDNPFPTGSQAYAFDFGHQNGAKGKNIRAARSGKVAAFRNGLTECTWGWSDKQVSDYLAAHPGLTPQALGGGNAVLVRHYDDQSVGAYLHLTPHQSFVTEVGQPIDQGQIIGLADKTGNASDYHLHFDVRLYWNSDGDVGPTLPIKFEDKNHKCWRPRVGDMLSSNNG
jgi:murein DD-endopeptidase MepM/ murein hydrolase activator NlpD